MHRLFIPLALTLCLALPVMAKKKSSQDGDGDGDGYYGSFKSPVQNAESPTGDGYYSAVPAYPAYKEPPRQPSTERAETTPPSPAVSQPAPSKTSAAVSTTPETFPVPPPLPGDPKFCPVEVKATLATAKAAFNKRDFLNALTQFKTLDKHGMCNETVHYYIARCYQQMGQVNAALQNYGYVIYRGKDPTLHNYALSAATQLEKYSAHRTYEGQGNNFMRYGAGPVGGGGGGGGGG